MQAAILSQGCFRTVSPHRLSATLYFIKSLSFLRIFRGKESPQADPKESGSCDAQPEFRHSNQTPNPVGFKVWGLGTLKPGKVQGFGLGDPNSW